MSECKECEQEVVDAELSWCIRACYDKWLEGQTFPPPPLAISRCEACAERDYDGTDARVWECPVCNRKVFVQP